MRIAALDGLRALAILMVIGYHYFARWINVYPYGQAIAPVFSYGYLGVWLFFIVSGFVIALTLEACATPYEFAVRRFARLWPPMLVCSAITFLIVGTLPVSVFHVAPINFLPSLTFIDPTILSKLFGENVSSMDGAYWSLYVEVRFYFWAALLFFSFRRRLTLPFLLLMNAVALSDALGERLIGALFVPKYFALFGIGLGFYYLYRKPRDVAAALLVVNASILSFLRLGAGERPIVAAFVLLFCALVFAPTLLRPFSLRPLRAIGEASYSLYLLHQFIGVSLIAWIAPHGAAGLATSALIAAALTLLSVLLYKYWEVPAREFVRRVARVLYRPSATR